ncbi:MAG: hypothetical protein QOH68_867 [Nocardioidaceae bacterium]|jgi:SDR family mycofactocin-dependent oxidoreductase|nr:hypothetical protein [Nocardioidaceae bacterium]
MRSLEGKVAFITGAGRGMGRADAVRLAEAGVDIIALDVDGELPFIRYVQPKPEDLEETVALVEARGRRIVARSGDVRDLEGMRELLAEATEELGGIDIVVANAGVCTPATWDNITSEQFQFTMDVNVTGVWNTVTASAPYLIERGGGSVILMSSYAGKKVQPFMLHYTASKHAVTGMTRAFAAELGKYDIRVNSIHPGGVNTPMASGDSNGMRSALQEAGEATPSLMGMATPFLPRHMAEPEEIADTIVFLASDAARHITAEHISMDGGAHWY